MRSLWPREHGAYAQLGLPLAAALALEVPTPSSILIALGACLAFLANEPLLVVLGHRGARARNTLGPAARRRLAITAGGAVVMGGAGLALAPPITLAICAGLAVPVAVMIGLAWTKTAHSLAGELVAAIALPGASVPVAVAAGTPWPLALELWVAWSLGYAAGVIAVHHVLAYRAGWTVAAWGRLGLLVGAAASSVFLAFARPAMAVSVPLVSIAAVAAGVWPSPRRLRTIGVVLVLASVVSGALAVTRT